MKITRVVAGTIVMAGALTNTGVVAASGDGAARSIGGEGTVAHLPDHRTGDGVRRSTDLGDQAVAGVRYVRPVDRSIGDPFRMDNGPYGAGNRGLKYKTALGDPVRASASGEVVFSGVVAGRASVTLRHADGRRTAVTGLTQVAVAKGDLILQGDLLGLATPRMHFSIREGSTYVDPERLLVGLVRRERHAVLVPLERCPNLDLSHFEGVSGGRLHFHLGRIARSRS